MAKATKQDKCKSASQTVHALEAAPPPPYDLKAADLIISAPVIGGKPPPMDNLAAASFTSGPPELTAPPLAQLKTAKKDDIRTEMKAAYDAARAAGEKPPNVKQLPDAVQPRLRARGLYAKKARILDIAPEFKNRRLPQGRHQPPKQS